MANRDHSIGTNWDLQPRYRPRDNNSDISFVSSFIHSFFSINSWGSDNDGLGNYEANFEIKGLNGQELSFLQVSIDSVTDSFSFLCFQCEPL